jgi:hypothetical protein
MREDQCAASQHLGVPIGFGLYIYIQIVRMLFAIRLQNMSCTYRTPANPAANRHGNRQC